MMPIHRPKPHSSKPMSTRNSIAIDVHLWILLGTSFSFKALLIHIFPEIYGADPVGRLLHKNDLFFSYWLPGLQTIILVVTRVADELLVLRYVMIAISTTAALAMYLLVRRIADREVALYSTTFFLFSPISVFLSLVPYQEMLFVTFAFTSMYFHFGTRSRRTILATSLFLGAACLTRYEAWLLAIVLLISYMNDGRSAKPQTQTLQKSFFTFIVVGGKAILLFAWAPIILIVAGFYTSPDRNTSLITPLAIETSPRFLLFALEKSTLW